MDSILIITLIFTLIAIAGIVFLIIKFLKLKTGSTSVYDSPGLSNLPKKDTEITNGTLNSELKNQGTLRTDTDKFCPNCGFKILEKDTKYCPNCGNLI